jgi:predicted nucleotide-binding protein (sugar kinase/HSP70/actin superfamily)
LGDVLYFLQKEKNRLKNLFNPADYVYFMPESDGPCRFGMYNKFHRLVLDTISAYKDVMISYLSTEDSYDTSQILPKKEASNFKKLAYVSTLIADVFDRISWRVRPYEKQKGSCDILVQRYLWNFIRLIQEKGRYLPFSEMFDMLSEMAKEATKLIDPKIPRKPQIGIVGEIYLRSHPQSNQNIIRKIEELGGEVTNASLGEWMNYVTFEGIRKLKREIQKDLRERNWKSLISHWKAWLSKDIEAKYQRMRQQQVYGAVKKYLDIHEDHDIKELEKKLDNKSIYSFEVGTEACLSIAGAISYIEENFHGVVNVFPFTCMPSTICSAILRPMLRERHIPYIDAPYDGTIQLNREIGLKTFMYQAYLRQKQLLSKP